MNFLKLIDKYAELAVKVGANVQQDQVLILNTSVECMELNRAIVKHAYEVGAKLVHIVYRDEEITRLTFEHQSIETLTEIPQWLIDSRLNYLKGGAAILNVVSNYPGNLKDITSEKVMKAAMATQSAFREQSEMTSANKVQWNIIAASNPVWAKTVFPDAGSDATDLLWKAIFTACRVEEDNDPIALWNLHNEKLAKMEDVMNDLNFETLHFTNSLGTDLHVGLVKNHVWAGGNEQCANGVWFNPNMPTEEVFTMPEKLNVNGRVFSSKPLDYQGKLVDEFFLDFKEGKVVAFDAKKEKEALESLINFDEGSCYIGEVALVEFDSPISNSNILFNNTLFDENASCHLALGRAYPMNVKGGTSMSKEELANAGANDSKTHVDFMFGTPDLKIVGTTYEGLSVVVFENGNFAI